MTTPPTLPELTRQFAHLSALEKLVTDYVKTQRTVVLDALNDLRATTNVKAVEVTDTDGTTLATASLVESKGGPRVINEAAFVAWVMENHFTELEYKVNDRFKKDLLARLVATDDGVVDTATGAIVDGVDFAPAGETGSFTLRWKPGGKDIAAANIAAGALTEILSLPQADSADPVVVPGTVENSEDAA